jgi:hypothetical protein
MLPVRNYWTPQKPQGHQHWETWRRRNDRLERLAEHVDVIYPSLYTFYENVEGWKRYAKANIDEARQYGKPVIPFIWPQYHNSNRTLRGKLVDGGYWRTQLDLVHRHTDGVVIWGGWQAQWDEDAGWWQETKAFIEATEEQALGIYD